MSEESVTEPVVEETPVEIPSESSPYGFIQDDGTFAPNWADALPEELSGYAPSVAKYQSLPELLKGHANLSKMIGADVVKIPGENATPEDLAAYRSKVGAPEDLAGYGLDKAPEEWPSDVPWDAERGNKVAEILHRHNIPAAAAAELAALERENAASFIEAQQAETENYSKELDDSLREAWGGEYDAKKSAAYQAAKTFGFDLADSSDPAAEVKAWAQVSKVLQEDESALKSLGLTKDGLSLVGDSPGARAQDIMSNPKNQYHDKYRNGDTETRKMVHSLLQQAEMNG